MAESPSPRLSDDELLANAIPIPMEIEEDGEAENGADPGLSSDGNDGRSTKIRTFARQQAAHEQWQRKPNLTGQGATHVRTFVSKLRLEALEHLDEQVNEWLDQHPEYEVKFVSTSVGQLVGKNAEDAVIMNVWV